MTRMQNGFQRWEYLRVSRTRKIKDGFVGAGTHAWEAEIDENRLGKQGWELVTIVSSSSTSSGASSAGLATDELWVFKRPLE